MIFNVLFDAIHQVTKSRICSFGGFFPHFISRLSFAAHFCDILAPEWSTTAKKHKNVPSNEIFN
jgi:hypothetical protein